MRHNKNTDSNRPAQPRGPSSPNRSTPNQENQEWGQKQERANRGNSESEFYSQSEGRYTELPEHELQGSQSSRQQGDYNSSRGKYTQYRDDNFETPSYQQDRQERQERSGNLDRNFRHGAVGTYSEYDRPSERSFDPSYATDSHSAYRSANSDLDSDAYRSQNYGSDYSNGNNFSDQRQTSNTRYDNRSDNRMGKFAGRGPKGYTRADERIREEVCDTLTRHHSIDASEIECEVKDGEVTLKGTVPERNMKLLAESMICDCQGVKDVSNQLKVQRDSQPTSGKDASTNLQNGKALTDKKSSKSW